MRLITISVMLAPMTLSACSGGGTMATPAMQTAEQPTSAISSTTGTQAATSSVLAPSTSASTVASVTSNSTVRSLAATNVSKATVWPNPVNYFAESIGYNEHLTSTNSVYWTDWSGIRSLTLASGAKHLRATAGNNTTVQSRLADLCANGIKHSIDFQINDTPATITSTINWYGGENCVDAVEPANEYDAYAGNPQHPDPNWVSHIITATRTLYNTIKSNPQFSKITVLGPGLASVINYTLLGNLESISDAGNLHWSNCDGSPLTTHYKNDVRSIQYLRVSYPRKPIWTTETANNDNSQYGCYLPDSVIAKYAQRTFLVRLNLGEPKTFIYEFADVPSEGSFGYQGVINSSGQPKLQYTAIQSLLSAVEAPDVPYSVSPLTYAISGSTSNVQTVLLQSSDGKYHLIIWLEVDSWDTSRHVILNPAPQTVTLSVPTSVRSATIATSNSNFTMSTRTISVSNGTFQTQVTDAPSVVSF